jgi:uncharacterized protein (DUF4415 family)
MSEPNIRRASLADIKRMKEEGELFHDANAPVGESLGPEFWAEAMVEQPRRPRSVHLKLDPEVFEFFHRQNGGKGHLTKMQNVLKAYANAHKG